MIKFFCRHQGTVSVFLALVLLPAVVFGGLVTDAVRVYHSKGLISEAGELAMNAGLSYYDVELKDAYGLLAMSKQPKDLDLEQYFVNTIRASGLEGAGDVRSFLDLKLDGQFTASGVDGSQIYQTEAEKQQILEYMKYRAPVCIGTELLDKLKQIRDSKKQVEAIEKQTEFAESMEDLQDACEKAKESLDEYLHYAEEAPVITKENINASLKESERRLSEAVRYLFMMYVCEHLEEKDESGSFIESMKGFNEKIGNAPEPEEENLERIFAAYAQGIFYQNNIPKSGLDQAVSDAKKSVSESEADEIDTVFTEYNRLVGRIAVYVANLKSSAYARIDTARYDISQTWKPKVEKSAAKVSDCTKKLDTVAKKLKEAQQAYQAWTEKIDRLPDDDMKTNMKNEAAKYTDLLDQNALDRLKSKLSENQDLLVAIEIKLEDTKLCGYSLTGNINKDDVKNKVYEMGLSLSVSLNNSDTMLSNAADREQQFMSANYETYEITEVLYSIKEDAFYQKLEELCTEKNKDPEKEKNNKDTTNTLLGKLKSALSGDGISDLNDIKWDEKTLPSTVLAQGESTGADNLDTDTGDSDSRSGRKKALKNARESLTSMSGWLDSISHILEGAIENIYITEYGIQMFSYYTVNKQVQPDGTVNSLEHVKSLSGDDVMAHKIDRSEVEYILWGKKNVQENVKNTKLLLYGIRMVFNMIYAFTDTEINRISMGMAEVMSCGIQFLVPVFKTVLQVGVAIGETACDVTDLLAGRDVPIIKDKQTRQIDLMNGGAEQKPTGAAKLTLNYKEYLTIFLLIKTVGSLEKTTLSRIADCIQLNTKLDLIQAYTMLSVGANVQSRTTFMKKAAELPDSSISTVPDDWYTIRYQSVLGY